MHVTPYLLSFLGPVYRLWSESASSSHTVEISTFRLRRLDESLSGGEDPIANIFLVVMCVLFAGFASGLTQV
ncbi:hypothetical protein EON63_03910 [archaeon]|nr:MAG: hypothetical protein EON63_03910 [archaeon]